MIKIDKQSIFYTFNIFQLHIFIVGLIHKLEIHSIDMRIIKNVFKIVLENIEQISFIEKTNQKILSLPERAKKYSENKLIPYLPSDLNERTDVLSNNPITQNYSRINVETIISNR